MENKKTQISVEYLVLLGFLVFIIISILGIAFFYAGNIRTGVSVNQISAFADKVITTSENVYYAGEPSRATITVYLPEGVNDIEIINNDLVFTFQTDSGINKMAFGSNVPIDGEFDTSSGAHNLLVEALEDKVNITQV